MSSSSPAATGLKCMIGAMQAVKSVWRWPDRDTVGRVRRMLQLMCSAGQYPMLRHLVLVGGQQGDGENDVKFGEASIQVGPLFGWQR